MLGVETVTLWSITRPKGVKALRGGAFWGFAVLQLIFEVIENFSFLAGRALGVEARESFRESLLL